ncbi:phosphotransferase family protein [Streptomyces sp. NPDC002917]|uniref:phosphotransferase family protein n=1 Tax=Streptomyces sp. NPDC002917 TaxID=3364671 RepID=UPI00369F40CD
MASPEGHGGFTAASAARAAAAACRKAGLPFEQARLLRLGENAIYALPAQNAVVRVARSAEMMDKVATELTVSRWLIDQGFPAAAPLNELPQPVQADGRLVTFWEYVPPSATAPLLSDLAALLHQLHALPDPGFPLPALDPFPIMRRRLEHASGIEQRDVEFLVEACDLSEAEFRRIVTTAPASLIHGDAHSGNLLVRGKRVLLIDFEAVATGPSGWDLIPTATAVDRFGLSRTEYQQFTHVYGRDITQWDGYEQLRSIQELGMTTWLMQNAQEGPHAAEFALRMQSLRKSDRGERWHAL